MISTGHRLPELEWQQLALEGEYFDQPSAISWHFLGFGSADYLRRVKELRNYGLHIKFNHLP